MLSEALEYIVMVTTVSCDLLFSGKRAGEDYGGGEFKRPRVEVSNLRTAIILQ